MSLLVPCSGIDLNNLSYFVQRVFSKIILRCNIETDENTERVNLIVDITNYRLQEYSEHEYYIRILFLY